MGVDPASASVSGRRDGRIYLGEFPGWCECERWCRGRDDYDHHLGSSPWRSGESIIPGQIVAYIVVGFIHTEDGTFTQHFGNMGSAEDAEALAEKKRAEPQVSPWTFKAAKVVLL